MANDFFRFKQFNIQQESCAMKVCTDSCLFGAYVDPKSARTILDIGTGTGLLALMLAQRTKQDTEIVAVELDEIAAEQAKFNIAQSPWAEKVSLINKSIQDYAAQNEKKFDLIISNPPFFHNQLKRTTAAQNLAMHSDALSFDELLVSVSKLLENSGRFIVLLPPAEALQILEKAERLGFYLHEKVNVIAVEGGKVIRNITTLSKINTNKVVYKDIIIKDQQNSYTNVFVDLLNYYYLYL